MERSCRAEMADLRAAIDDALEQVLSRCPSLSSLIESPIAVSQSC
jgi:hypothetical protein